MASAGFELFLIPSAGLLSFIGASTGVLAVTILAYTSWKSLESARVRQIVRNDAGGTLPMPAPLLPKWCGFVGGHTLLIKPSKLVQHFEEWAKEFGGDYELQIFGSRAIVVTAVADIRRILALRPSKFRRGLWSKKGAWAAQEIGLTPSMFFDEGKDWGRSRRLISPHLNGHNVSAMLPLISKVGERLCAKLDAQVDAGEVVDAKDTFERFTHDVIALSAFGIDVDSLRGTPNRPCPSFDAMASATASIIALTVKPLSILGWKTLSSALPWVRQAKKHSLGLRNVVKNAIDAVRSENSHNGPSGKSRDTFQASVEAPGLREAFSGGSLLRRIVGTRQTKDSSNRMAFSDQEVLNQVKSLFIAGTETSSLTLCWAMYYLTKHPKVFARCRAEALQVAPLSAGMVYTSEQLSQLRFCSAVFKEAVRLRTPAPFLFFHCTDDYTMKNGSEFEKGTSFCVLNRAASISEGAFTRGSEFIPERWIANEREEALLGKNEGGGRRNVCHTEESFLSFGAGPRVCPGQDMAKTEGAVVIAAICARFKVSLAPNQLDPPEEIFSFTMGPKSIKLVFEKMP